LDLTDEVRVTSEHLSGLSPFAVFFIVLFVIEVPSDEGLISGSREEEFNSFSVHFFFTNSEGGNPAAVTFKVSLVFERVLCLFLIFH